MVRAATIYRGQVILRSMETDADERGTPALRDDRTTSPSLLRGEPAIEQHDEPSATG